MLVKNFRSKPDNFQAVELTGEMTLNGKTAKPGDFLFTSEAGEQFIVSKEEAAVDYEEIKPRTRKPSNA